MPILNLLPRENMLFGTEGIELYKGGNYIDSHGAYPNGTSYDFTTRISFNASTGHITFQYHDDVTGGVTIQKGGLTINAGGASITGNETINGHTYISGAHHIYFDSGHGHGIIWRENTTTYAGEALYVGGYFLGSDDSNYLHIQGSTTGGTSVSWHDIMRLTATSGNLWIKGTGTFGSSVTLDGGVLTVSNGSVYAGTNGSTTAERQISVRSGAGILYMYSQASTSGNRGLYGANHAGTYTSYLTIDQSNNLALQSANRAGTLARNIRIENSGGTALSSNYILVRRG